MENGEWESWCVVLGIFDDGGEDGDQFPRFLE
jgi:hypothetical protein